MDVSKRYAKNKHLRLSANKKKHKGKNLKEWRMNSVLIGSLEPEQQVYAEADDDFATVSGDTFTTMKDIDEKLSGEFPDISGRRIFDIKFLFEQIKRLSHHNAPTNCGFSDMDITRETRKGMESAFQMKCRMCGFEDKLQTSDPSTKKMDVNVAAVSAMIYTGQGYTQLEEIMSVLEIPCMASSTYQRHQERLHSVIRDLAWEKMKEAGKEEVRLAVETGDVDMQGIPFIMVVADGAWAKRSYRTNYSSLSGVACIIGYRTNKILYIGVRNKYCSICARSAGNDEEVKSHICYKNWTKSSTAMEADIIVEGFKNSVAMHGLKYAKLIDVGEPDSFLGQNEVPSLPLPGIQSSALKTPSPEQLQPITFFNALGQPTGGGGLDFLAPAGANTKSIDSSTQSRYKQLVNKRRPLSASLGVIPSRSLNVPPASSSTDLLPPTSVESSTTVDSPLLQEPSISSLLSLLTPKSSSTPTTPKNQIISTSSSGNVNSKSQSIPSTLKSSPVHVQSTLHENPVPLKPESAYSNVQPLDQTFTPDTGTLGLSLVQKLLNLTSETLSPSPQKQLSSYKQELTDTHSADDVSSRGESVVSEAIVASEFSTLSESGVSETKPNDGISTLLKSETHETKLSSELSAPSEPKSFETGTASEPIAEKSNSVVQTADTNVVESFNSSFESTVIPNGTERVSASITSPFPLNVSNFVSNTTYYPLGVNLNETSSYQYPKTIDKNIPSSEETKTLVLPSSKSSSLPGGISDGLCDDPKSSLTTENHPSHSEKEVLISDDQTSRAVDQLEASDQTVTKVTNSYQSEGTISSYENESQVVTNKESVISQGDTKSIQHQAKSPSTLPHLLSAEHPPLQPIISPIETQSTAATNQNSGHSLRTSQENYQYTGNQFSYQALSGVSIPPIPTSSVSANIQANAALNNAQSSSSQHLPFVSQESHTPALNPLLPPSATGTQSSPNPYRVRSSQPPISSPLQYTNSPLYNPQQFFIPVAQNSVSSSYSQPASREFDSGASQFSLSNPQHTFPPQVSHQSSLPAQPSPIPPPVSHPTPPPAKQLSGIPQPSSNIYSVHANPPSDQVNSFLVSKPPPIFSSPQQPTSSVYPSATPPLIPAAAPPPAAPQSTSSQPSFNRYSIHAKPPSRGGVNANRYHPNAGQFPPFCPPSSQPGYFPLQPTPTPPSTPVPTPPPVQQIAPSQASSNSYSEHSKSPANDALNASKFPPNTSHPPLTISSTTQQPSIPAQPSPTPPLTSVPLPSLANPAIQKTVSSQPSSNKYSIHGTSSANDLSGASKFPLNTAHPPLTCTTIPQKPFPGESLSRPPQLPVQPSPTPPLIPVPTPPPAVLQTGAPKPLNWNSASTQPTPFLSPNLQQTSHPSQPPSTPPLTPALGPPPLAQGSGTSQASANRYSIHARPAHLRNPYRVFSPSASQSSPNINHPQPPSTLSPYLITPEASSDSFSSVPLTSETSFEFTNNLSSGQKENQPSPLPTSPPLVPTFATPQQIQENIQKSFPAQGAVTSPSYPPSQSSNVSESVVSRTSGSFAVEKPNQLPPSVDIPLANNSPASGTLILPQSSQGSSSVQLNAATPPNTVPTISSSLHPPSGIPLGSAQGYRLGKQKPKYAQVPDLVVSPCSPLYSPVVLSSNEPGASPSEFSPYQTQECFVPSENFAYPNSEFSSSLYANLAQQGSNVASAVGGYQPVYCHWFFRKEIESKAVWKPFSLIDSAALEDAFNSSETNADTIIPTDGGRYDVHILQRERIAVYWEEKKPTEVRRCSWFYKGPLDSRYTPYEEIFASQLEEEYKLGVQSNKWNRKVEYNGETVVMHGPVVMVHYAQTPTSDQIGVVPDSSPVKPRVVKRGVDEFEFEEGEASKVDHLLFLVHGIGSVCDLKFRDVVETVDDFRSLALQLTRSHFSACVESGQANRVEVLPVSWHGKLHGEDTGIDKKLQSITLKSIPRLRYFTNDTLLDILFYTSPVYCQTIMDTVGNEMNRMYDLFLRRNPDFKGTVCLGGHSLGSLILFDLLYHQKPPKNVPRSPAIVMTSPGAHPPPVSESKPEKNEEEGEEEDDIVDDNAMAMSFARLQGHNRRASRVNYMMGPAGTGQPFISYPQLKFKPESFFALGSPIGMFVTVRGIETLGSSFRLPTCPGFFNIFHPFDPVAYRIESLIDPELASNLRPVTIPHHKGRKRMHLELKETMQRVGSDLKNKLVDSVKNTWNTMAQYTMFSRPEPPPAQPTIELQVTKALEAHLGPAQVDPPSENESEVGDQPTDITLGCLNGGRRVDYVLQEAPLESFNEYLFALQSHVCYWESEDTMLMILTEVYRGSDVSPDSVLMGSEIARDRSPIKLLSDQFLPSPSPPKSQLFSSLRFPSSSSLSSDGTGEGVSRSQSIPKLDKEASPTLLSSSSPADLQLQGGLPPMGVDPTAPMGEAKNLAPPPMGGFVKQALQRK